MEGTPANGWEGKLERWLEPFLARLGRIDVLTQIRAIRAALRGVEDAVLKDHVEHCVEDAIASGDGGEQRRKVQELVTALTQRDR